MLTISQPHRRRSTTKFLTSLCMTIFILSPASAVYAAFSAQYFPTGSGAITESSPTLADINGDGIDEIGIYRNGQWYLDLNGNRELEATDKVFELGTASEHPVTGDWDGDGTDDFGTYQSETTQPPQEVPHNKAG